MSHVVNPNLYRLKYTVNWFLYSVSNTKHFSFFDTKVSTLREMFVDSFNYNNNQSNSKIYYLISSFKISFKNKSVNLFFLFKQTLLLKRKITKLKYFIKKLTQLAKPFAIFKKKKTTIKSKSSLNYYFKYFKFFYLISINQKVKKFIKRNNQLYVSQLKKVKKISPLNNVIKKRLKNSYRFLKRAFNIRLLKAKRFKNERFLFFKKKKEEKNLTFKQKLAKQVAQSRKDYKESIRIVYFVRKPKKYRNKFVLFKSKFDKELKLIFIKKFFKLKNFKFTKTLKNNFSFSNNSYHLKTDFIFKKRKVVFKSKTKSISVKKNLKAFLQSLKKNKLPRLSWKKIFRVGIFSTLKDLFGKRKRSRNIKKLYISALNLDTDSEKLVKNIYRIKHKLKKIIKSKKYKNYKFISKKIHKISFVKKIKYIFKKKSKKTEVKNIFKKRKFRFKSLSKTLINRRRKLLYFRIKRNLVNKLKPRGRKKIRFYKKKKYVKKKKFYNKKREKKYMYRLYYKPLKMKFNFFKKLYKNMYKLKYYKKTSLIFIHKNFLNLNKKLYKKKLKRKWSLLLKKLKHVKYKKINIIKKKCKKYLIIPAFAINFFFKLKILVFKFKITFIIFKFFSSIILSKIVFLFKKFWGAIRTSEMFADAIIIRLLKKNKIKDIVRSTLKYLLKLYRKKRLRGYALLFMGRFTRKDRAMYSWYKSGLYSRSNRLTVIDFSNKKVALKYSTCSFKISLIRSRLKRVRNFL